MKTNIKIIFASLLTVLLVGCVDIKNHTKVGFMPLRKDMKKKEIPMLTEVDKKIVARITYYNNREAGGDRIAACSKSRAKEGITVAAHPDFKFGTRIVIPALKNKLGNGEFVVEDRGSAVTSKKASKGKTYVFDIFIRVNSLREAKQKELALNKLVGDYTDVYIVNGN